jgi:valyl-tRNA synthetase
MRPGRPEALQQPYDPARIEGRWYSEWESGGVFKPRESGKPPFVIMIPPPNVTGSLTMGHVLGE